MEVTERGGSAGAVEEAGPPLTLKTDGWVEAGEIVPVPVPTGKETESEARERDEDEAGDSEEEETNDNARAAGEEVGGVGGGLSKKALKRLAKKAQWDEHKKARR
jgi:hypothetical protein